MEKVFKQKKGITLIALVITIIVLLILAGISISMLSGDNSILNKATDAKERTTEGQVKEEISLAWNGVQTEGIINGWEIGKKAEELQKELKKGDSSATATASGNDINVKSYKGYDATINTTNGSFTKFAKSGGTENPENNKLELTANVKETESRAAIIEVSVEAGEAPTEEELQAKSQEVLRFMFVAAIQSIGAPYKSWSEIPGVTNTTTIEDVFGQFRLSQQGYKNAYDLIIQTGTYAEPATFTLSGEEPITGTNAEFVVTKNGSYTITASRGGVTGTVTKEVTQCVNRKDNQVETFKYATSSDGTMDEKGNCTITQEQGGTTYTAVIPAGFAYGTSSNVGTIANGLVITDSIDESTGYSTGNEFVWIPIDKDELNPIGTTDKAMANKAGTQGILYKIDSNGNDVGTEPTLLNAYDVDEEYYMYDGDEKYYKTILGYNSSTDFGDAITSSYSNMIASVRQYRGFYVGRYEMGKGSGNYSKIGITPTSANDSETSTWYKLYKKANEYTIKSSVKSQMIWGSQYDAMLNFALVSTDNTTVSKVTANTNGNHSGRLLKTGACPGSDSINNIFDLEGNLWEWTQEGDSTVSRVYRGGCFSTNNALSPSYRWYWNPDETYDSLGSRLSLYIQ